nr:putative integron gene cassette protein [uncultured bacterium]
MLGLTHRADLRVECRDRRALWPLPCRLLFDVGGIGSAQFRRTLGSSHRLKCQPSRPQSSVQAWILHEGPRFGQDRLAADTQEDQALAGQCGLRPWNSALCLAREFLKA